MKKHCKRGFSLAEALVTLLIVCLITIASIPVITKKKRSFSNANGYWACTRNSEGNYVYYDKLNPQGDANNPDTWKLTNTDSCTFKPPLNAERFTLTVIGGGGGGGNGYSELSNVREVTSGSQDYKAPRDAYYFVEVTGGGGGGGDTVSNSELPNAVAAGGGSGGSYEASIKLLGGSVYTLTAGNGGGIGSSEYHSGYNRSSNTRDSGGTGGRSSIVYKSGADKIKTEISVTGGAGGDSTSYNADNHATGGSATGVGGSVTRTITIDAKNEIKKTGNNGTGGSARFQYCANIAYNYGYGGGGKSVATSGAGYGGRGGATSAGDGCYLQPAYDPLPGTNGLVKIGLLDLHFGTAGQAATPISHPVHKFNGDVVVKIADAALSENKGGSTVATVVKNGKEGRKYIGAGAEGGKKSNSISEPEAGQNSLFTLLGGGAPASACKPPENKPAGYGKIEVPVVKCTQIKCSIAPGHTTLQPYSKDKNDHILEKNKDELNNPVYPTGFSQYMYDGELGYGPNNLNCSFDSSGNEICENPVYMDTVAKANDAKNYIKNIMNMTNYIKYTTGVTEFTTELFEKYFPRTNIEDTVYDKEVGCLVNGNIDPTKGEFCNFDNWKDIYDNNRCYRDSNIIYTKTCTALETSVKEISGYHAATTIPATCEDDAGQGTSFGAGGGGGNASDTPNVQSQGGKGGYGAVVIEW